MPAYGTGDIEAVVLDVLAEQGVMPADPIIREVNCMGGPASVGVASVVSICGTYFKPTATVKIAGVAVSPVTFIDDNELRVTYTPTSSGAKDVSVTTHVEVTKTGALSVLTDTIASILTTSLSAYNSATAGEWLEITAAEYTALASGLTSVSKIGCTDARYNVALESGDIDKATLVNNNGGAVPANSYVFAFKRLAQNNKDPVENERVLITTASPPNNNVNTIGGEAKVLPRHITVADQSNFFLYKNPPIANPGAVGYLGYNCVDSKAYYQALGSFNCRYSTDGYVRNGLASIGYNAMYQGLSTTVKQW